jgi:hypothetical protein
MTHAQSEALEHGSLDDQCLDAHPSMVCVHCGTCRNCMSGCECDDPQGAEPCDCGGCEEDHG